MRTEEHHVAVSRKRKPREGWDSAFKLMAERGEDVLLDGQTATRWDSTEWDWSTAEHNSPWRLG